MPSWRSLTKKKQDPESDQDPKLLVKGTDPRIRIRTKISRIRNTSTMWS